MNTEKVFTAFNKDGEEILIYRKDNDTYIDLISDNNDVYPKENIDLESLTPASRSINLRHHMLQSTIKRKYKKDRKKLIETKKILLGAKVTITNLEEKEIDSGLRYYGMPITDTHYEWEESDVILGLYTFSKTLKLKVKNETYIFNLYKNMYNHENYITFSGETKYISKIPEFKNGWNYARVDTHTLEYALKESYIEKKKVYEYANIARKEKLEERK